MSDLYDSLEDEPHDKFSSNCQNSTNRQVLFPVQGAYLSETRNNDAPFYLSKNVSVLPNVECDRKVPSTGSRGGNFLPKIENSSREKGTKSVSNIIVSNEILSKQGLQLNTDGSFTKSPRSDEEELPFITREYKNLQFQKKKTYQLKKRPPFVKIQRKNIFTFTDNPEKGVSMIGIISARKKKGTSEELLTSGGSLSSFHESSKKEKEFVVNDNMTDSMKEMLLQKQNENRLRSQHKVGNVRKSKRILNLDSRKSLKQKLPECGQKQQVCPKVETGAKSLCNMYEGESGSYENIGRTFRKRVVKHPLESVVNPVRTRLSYSERRQLEIGLNPMCLKQEKKVFSETNRSNFGDSVADKLSEISSRVLSSEDITDDEDEEIFYRAIIEKEKSRKLRVQHSARSAPLEDMKTNDFVSSVTMKARKECRGSLKNSSTCKGLSKSTSIDMPVAADKSSVHASRKLHSHYCSTNSSPTMSKTELAQKAKAYGYLANARNIFKLKTQSEGKLSSTRRETSPKVCENNGLVLNKQRSSIFTGAVECSENPPRTSKSLCRTEEFSGGVEKQKSFYLPRVGCPESLDGSIKTEILKQISSCLQSSVTNTEYAS